MTATVSIDPKSLIEVAESLSSAASSLHDVVSEAQISEGVSTPESATVAELEEIRALVVDLRDAFGCGQIDISPPESSGTDLATFVSYLGDVVRAIEDWEEWSLSDVEGKVATLRREWAYAANVDVSGFEDEGCISDDVKVRIQRMRDAFDGLAALGFIDR